MGDEVSRAVSGSFVTKCNVCVANVPSRYSRLICARAVFGCVLPATGNAGLCWDNLLVGSKHAKHEVMWAMQGLQCNLLTAGNGSDLSRSGFHVSAEVQISRHDVHMESLCRHVECMSDFLGTVTYQGACGRPSMFNTSTITLARQPENCNAYQHYAAPCTLH
jgi:hypothetical protein